MDLISVEEAARILGVTGRRVRVLITERRLPALRVGRRVYVVDRNDAERFGETPRPTGRPRTSKNVVDPFGAPRARRPARLKEEIGGEDHP